jgi:hypothetical protein
LKNYFAILMVIFCVLISGCAEVDVPKPDEIIKNPLGPGSVRVGMTKDQVVNIYGEPNIKGMVTSSKWGGSREEWIYEAQASALPVSAGYLGEDLYLYFDGENLTNISKKPLGKETSAEDIK